MEGILDTSWIEIQTIMVECKIMIDELDAINKEEKTLRSLFVPQRLISIYLLIYPSTVCKFYIEMEVMPKNANTHIISIHGVQSEILKDIFIDLFEIP